MYGPGHPGTLLLWNSFGFLLAAPIVIRVFVPFYAKLSLYTAYEYLERRFDLRVRLLDQHSIPCPPRDPRGAGHLRAVAGDPDCHRPACPLRGFSMTCRW